MTSIYSSFLFVPFSLHGGVVDMELTTSPLNSGFARILFLQGVGGVLVVPHSSKAGSGVNGNTSALGAEIMGSSPMTQITFRHIPVGWETDGGLLGRPQAVYMLAYGYPPFTNLGCHTAPLLSGWVGAKASPYSLKKYGWAGIDVHNQGNQRATTPCQ